MTVSLAMCPDVFLTQGGIIELTVKKEKVLIEDGTEEISLSSYFVLTKKVCICP